MFDLGALRDAVAAHGAVARVVVAGVAGSAPREAGAAMIVHAGGQAGTIGGGALEWEAARAARALIGRGGAEVVRVPLGPARGQCCGGAVTLVSEVWDAEHLAALKVEAGMVARALPGAGPMPLSVTRIIARARGEGVRPGAQIVGGWIVEPLAVPRRRLWVWGAGHVGRAVVRVLAPLPEFGIVWVDTEAARFPEAIPAGVLPRIAARPGDLVAEAPVEAEHLILTFSHALDLDLCHRLLSHGFARAGLIGSATKWVRFRARLAALGHTPAQIARITCPIGDPSLGKHPQAIALGVATELMRPQTTRAEVAQA